MHIDLREFYYQDYTGIPAVADLAAMREAVKEKNKDPKKINPLSPVDLVIDHSVQVDDLQIYPH